MATCKTVWFSESDPERWFEKREDAERFDKIDEVALWVIRGFGGVPAEVESVIERIMERYEITERWDYKKPEQGPQG